MGIVQLWQDVVSVIVFLLEKVFDDIQLITITDLGVDLIDIPHQRIQCLTGAGVFFLPGAVIRIGGEFTAGKNLGDGHPGALVHCLLQG